jgi:hypothetical protein
MGSTETELAASLSPVIAHDLGGHAIHHEFGSAELARNSAC